MKLAERAEKVRLARLHRVRSTFKTSTLNKLHPSTRDFRKWKKQAKKRDVEYSDSWERKHEQERIRRIRNTKSSVNTGLRKGRVKSRRAKSRRAKERDLAAAMRVVTSFGKEPKHIVRPHHHVVRVPVESCVSYEILDSRTPISKSRAAIAAKTLSKQQEKMSNPKKHVVNISTTRSTSPSVVVVSPVKRKARARREEEEEKLDLQKIREEISEERERNIEKRRQAVLSSRRSVQEKRAKAHAQRVRETARLKRQRQEADRRIEAFERAARQIEKEQEAYLMSSSERRKDMQDTKESVPKTYDESSLTATLDSLKEIETMFKKDETGVQRAACSQALKLARFADLSVDTSTLKNDEEKMEVAVEEEKQQDSVQEESCSSVDEEK